MGLQGVLQLAAKLAVAWRLAPYLPAACGRVASAVGAAADAEALKRRVRELEARLAASQAGGANGGADALFFPDPAM